MNTVLTDFYFDEQPCCPDWSGEMRYVVCYDIANDKQRTRLARLLGEYGDRIQKSVFEFFLSDGGYREMWTRVLGEVEVEQEDRIRAIPLCLACEKKLEVVGPRGRERGEVEVYVIV
ncbi:CRISPR-associated endonuclease Cas2 [bacterium]|nr:CRISPR-associated endonuclease Cas2 [bacterium]